MNIKLKVGKRSRAGTRSVGIEDTTAAEDGLEEEEEDEEGAAYDEDMKVSTVKMKRGMELPKKRRMESRNLRS